MLLLHAHSLSALAYVPLSTSSAHLSGKNSAEDAAAEPLRVVCIECILDCTNLLSGGTREHWLYRLLLALSALHHAAFCVVFTYILICVPFILTEFA